jgi:hypothetical protein
MSIDGKVIQSHGERPCFETDLNVSDVAVGLYIVRTISDQGIFFNKIIIE